MRLEIDFDISPKDTEKFKRRFENFCVQYLAYMEPEYYKKITKVKISGKEVNF